MRDGYNFTDSQRGAIVKSNKERITIRLPELGHHQVVPWTGTRRR